ncbi:FadR/GntR family transcriptional regulator [Sneathiella glossodoripedis]|uniref:FadR/GntR family transcriptional regulator n=1 Tax=Sneathiella glossodoripedis TaxID=418853 RepID=UPI00046E8D07|nr:FCD domain-containing protein [Sneathiella glossodoripedis]
MIGSFDRRYPKNGIHGRVVHEVGRAIVNGRFKEGERLPKEDFFIDRYNGSRTAIREAFRVLTAKGLLEAKQRAGTSVRKRKYWNIWDPDVLCWQRVESLTKGHAEQLMQVRQFAEPEAARLHAMKPNELGGVRYLEKACQMIHRAWEEGNIDKSYEAELAFHTFLLETCGNEYIARMRDAVRLSISHCQYKQYRSVEARRGPSRWYAYVVERIKEHDGDAAYSGAKTLIGTYIDAARRERDFLGSKPNAVA